MKQYEHRQWSRWAFFVGLVVVPFMVWLPFGTGNPVVVTFTGPLALTVLIVTIAFSTLTTRVGTHGVLWSFTFGAPGGFLPWSKIADAEITTLKLLERGGSGVHWTAWHGWLWNVGGACAVEFYGPNGERTTLGTNDPEGFLAAVRQGLSHAAVQAPTA